MPCQILQPDLSYVASAYCTQKAATAQQCIGSSDPKATRMGMAPFHFHSFRCNSPLGLLGRQQQQYKYCSGTAHCITVLCYGIIKRGIHHKANGELTLGTDERFVNWEWNPEPSEQHGAGVTCQERELGSSRPSLNNHRFFIDILEP